MIIRDEIRSLAARCDESLSDVPDEFTDGAAAVFMAFALKAYPVSHAEFMALASYTWERHSPDWCDALGPSAEGGSDEALRERCREEFARVAGKRDS